MTDDHGTFGPPDAGDPFLADEDAARLDARTLRGLAHPVRVRLLGLLRIEGPSTATRLAERLRLSSAATSYHLRQLETYGFVTEDPTLGQPRERWWRAVHRSTTFDMRPSSDPEAAEAGETYLRGVARVYSDNVEAYLDERPQLPEEWQGAGTLSDIMLRLTADETEELTRELWSIVRRRREGDATDAPEGARRVTVQLQVFPRAGEES